MDTNNTLVKAWGLVEGCEWGPEEVNGGKRDIRNIFSNKNSKITKKKKKTSTY